MQKYFKDDDLSNLKKAYFKLMKKYHPDLVQDEREKMRRNDICAEINAEYDMLVKQLSYSMVFKKTFEKENSYNKYNEIINGSILAKKACEDIIVKLQKPDIEYRYYHFIEGVDWSEDEVLKEIDATVLLFWRTCYDKRIIGDEFAKLYELCSFNAEKMKRTIMFLSTGAISENSIHNNLQSSNAIPFFNDNIVVNNLPDYDSFLLLNKNNTKRETFEAWISFCQKQRDDFLTRYNDMIVKRISSSKVI